MPCSHSAPGECGHSDLRRQPEKTAGRSQPGRVEVEPQVWLCVSRTDRARRQVRDPLFTCRGGGPHFPESEKGAQNVHLPLLEGPTDNVRGAGEAGCPQDRGHPRPPTAGLAAWGWGWRGARCRRAPLDPFASVGSAGPRAAPPHAPSRPLGQVPARDGSVGPSHLVQTGVSSSPRPFQGRAGKERPTTAPFWGVSQCSLGPLRKAHLCTPI